jgi:hypothetical protein
MKKLIRLLLILIVLPVFILLLLIMLPLILLLIGFYSLLAGRKWINGIKWYTKTAKGVAVKEEFRRQDKSGTPSGDSVYDVRYDVLMSTPSKDADDKKPLQEGGRPVA